MCASTELINNEIIILFNSSTETNLPEDVGTSADGGLVGAVIGSLVGVLIIGLVVFYCVSKWRKTRNKRELNQGE